MTQTDQEQDAELADHQHRLERLEQVFPTPETPRGGAQRARLHVPTPDSLLTVGAAGHATSEGRAEGPGGVALHTVENLGAQIQGSTILDTDGNTILHTGEEARVLAEADAAISSNANVRVGSIEDVEITAGGVGFTDPAFTVRPAMAVPSPPEVNTARSRDSIRSVKNAWTYTWKAWSIKSALSSWLDFMASPTEGVQEASTERNTARVLGFVRSTMTLGEGLWGTLTALGAAFEDPNALDHTDSGPQMKLHAVGGMTLSSSGKISAFSEDSVSVGAPINLSLKAGSSASMSAGGNAKIFGIASATLQSEGVVGIKGKVVGTGGDYIEMKAKQGAFLKSEGAALVEAKGKAALDGDQVAVAGNTVDIGGKDRVEVTAKVGLVDVKGEQRVRVRSPNDVIVQGDRSVQLRQGRATLAVDNDQIELRAGSTTAILTSSDFSVHRVRIRSGETTIRGRVNLG